MDDVTLGKSLAEVHREYADYRRPEGVCVSPSSMSVMVDPTGKPVEEMIAEERESSSAQIRTLFDEQRNTIIAECCENVTTRTPSSSSRTRTQNSTGGIMASATGFS